MFASAMRNFIRGMRIIGEPREKLPPMNDHLFAPVPAQHREAVRAALATTFGEVVPTALEPLTAGFSGAHVWKVVVADAAYVIRLVTQRT
jgi:hypothetical protein